MFLLFSFELNYSIDNKDELHFYNLQKLKIKFEFN